MASSSCQATTSLTACACASSKMPSCFRKSSMLEPIWFLRRLCFLLIVSFLESSHDHLTRDDRKPLQKVFECFSTLQIVEQRLDRHARTAKHRSSTKDIRVRDNDSHGMIVSRGWPRGGMALGAASLRALPSAKGAALDFPLGENSGVIHSQSCIYKFTIDIRPDPWCGFACYLEPAPPSDPFNPFVISHFHSHVAPPSPVL